MTPNTSADAPSAAPAKHGPTIALRTSSVLWVIWGVFHVSAGITTILILSNQHPVGDLGSVPETVTVNFLGTDAAFAIIGSLKQHGYNLAWFGVVVTIGAIYAWRGSRLGVATAVVVGGLADLGYFLFVDLAGYAEPPGPQMTWIMAAAIALAVYAYFASNRLRFLHT